MLWEFVSPTRFWIISISQLWFGLAWDFLLASCCDQVFSIWFKFLVDYCDFILYARYCFWDYEFVNFFGFLFIIVKKRYDAALAILRWSRGSRFRTALVVVSMAPPFVTGEVASRAGGL